MEVVVEGVSVEDVGVVEDVVVDVDLRPLFATDEMSRTAQVAMPMRLRRWIQSVAIGSMCSSPIPTERCYGEGFALSSLSLSFFSPWLGSLPRAPGRSPIGAHTQGTWNV